VTATLDFAFHDCVRPCPPKPQRSNSSRAFEEMSAMIFLRRLWKIPQLTTSIRLPNFHVNDFWDTKATNGYLRASAAAENGLPRRP
jgi:hypothetical protein